MNQDTAHLQIQISLSDLWSHTQSLDPHLCRALLPRRYAIPKTHGDPQFAAMQLVAGVRAYEEFPDNFPAHCAALTAGRLIQSHVPTYCIGPELLRAAMRTDSDLVGWGDIKWPWNGALFLLPHGVLQSPNDGALGFLAIARNEANQPFYLPGRQPLATRDNSITVCAAAASGDMPLFGANVAQERLRDTAGCREYDDELVATKEGWMLQEKAADPDDIRFGSYLFRTALALLLIMNARPGLASIGNPNWLGKGYDRLRSISPRTSVWTRGKIYVNQKRDGRKLIWQEPA